MPLTKEARDHLKQICEKWFGSASFFQKFAKDHGVTEEDAQLHILEFDKQMTQYDKFNKELSKEEFIYGNEDLKTWGMSRLTQDGVVYIKYLSKGKIHQDFNLDNWVKRENKPLEN